MTDTMEAHVLEIHKAAHSMLREAGEPDLIGKVDILAEKLNTAFEENELSVVAAAIGHILGVTLDDPIALQVVLGTINVAAFTAQTAQKAHRQVKQ